MSTTQNTTDGNTVSARLIWQNIKKKKKLILIVLPTVIVVTTIILLSIPHVYTSDTYLAPEINVPSTGGSLSSLASSLGFNLNDRTTTDAIYPTLYPDLMEDNRFVASLFNIKVRSLDNSINTTYYNYLKEYKKKTWWSVIMKDISQLVKKKEPVDLSNQSNKKLYPYLTSDETYEIMKGIRDNITIDVSNKTSVITVSVTEQDPLISKIMADSVCARLQLAITDYRTKKARNDVEYYTKLTNDARKAYEKVRRQYASSSDANMDVILETTKSKTEDLENDMQLKYNTYTTMQTQLQAAQAKLREYTPAFTILKGAEVPVLPSAPARTKILIVIFVLTCLILGAYANKEILKQYMKSSNEEED